MSRASMLIWGLAGTLVFLAAGDAGAFVFKVTGEGLVVEQDGSPWLATVTPTFDPHNRETTYKVFTHIYDFEGDAPITKGAGGKYTHHRGMFIGWKDTLALGEDFDTWHMSNCYQAHRKWARTEVAAGHATQVEAIDWCTEQGRAFIEETRTITASEGEDGVRLFDFQSELKSVAGDIELRGDLQHAGMQVRMANEVSEHEDTTQYLLPEGAEELDNDKVVGAWWVCCSPVVRGKRYWVVHMTPRGHPTGEPVYSIRRYARFGAFFETDLTEGQPLTLGFRVAVSEKELDLPACQQLYETYNAE